MEARVFAIESNMAGLRGQLEDNIKLTRIVADDTLELRTIFSEARGAFRLFTKIMSLIRYVFKYIVLPVAGLFATVYTYKHGVQAAWWISLKSLIG